MVAVRTELVTEPVAPAPIIIRAALEAAETAVVPPAAVLAAATTAVAHANGHDDHANGHDRHAERDDDHMAGSTHEHELGLDDDLDTDDIAEHHEARHEIGSEVLAEPAEDDELALDDLGESDDEAIDEQPAAATDTRRVVRVEETMRVPAGFGTIVRALGMAVSGFAALALVVRVAPEQTSAWLSRLPVAGAGFAHERNLTSKVELKNVQGRFQRLRNARRVFVISGDARNNSPMTIERIEVAGALYGLGGGELDQKVVTTGNRTTLTDLSEAEIALLQRLDPVIALAPGETTPFLIVFLEPPRELREFSSRVLSARPTRRASTPPLRPAAPGSVG